MEQSRAPLKELENCNIQTNSRQPVSQLRTNYDTYRFSTKEWIFYTAKGLLLISLFAYIFYRSVIAFLLLLPSIFFLLKHFNRSCMLQRKSKLSLEFREMMNSLIASLEAGYSVENAITKTYKELTLLFGSKSYICTELASMIKALRNNQNIEELFYDFGQRSGIEDIRDFGDIFKISKRSGGDLTGILKHSAEIITDKIEVHRKIDSLIASKKFESTIMNYVPFGIIFYIDLTSPGFFDSLYHNLFGIILMTVLLIIYLLAYLLSERITTINI